jgi:hypothetical protein
LKFAEKDDILLILRTYMSKKKLILIFAKISTKSSPILTKAILSRIRAVLLFFCGFVEKSIIQKID